MTTSNAFLKDPSAILDYVWDWKSLTNGTGTGDWLASAEAISSHTVTAPTGLTVDSSALVNTNTAVRAWLSGGTAGESYAVVCRIVTTANRTDERTIYVQVVNR
jgi:hypothetical protein